MKVSGSRSRAAKAEHEARVTISQGTLEGFPILLTTKQAARILGWKPGSLAVFRCVGRHAGLKFIRLGRRTIRYRLQDIQEFIALRAGEGQVQSR